MYFPPRRRKSGRARHLAPWYLAGVVGAWGMSGGPVSGQEAATVQGRVHDTEGAAVAGAVVTLDGGATPDRSVGTDPLGSFRITSLPPGSYTLTVAAFGYEAAERVVELAAGETVDLELAIAARPIEVSGIEVEAERSRERARFEDVGAVTVREMRLRDLRSVPGVVETDPLRAVEVLPGVVSTSDFSASFNVRGGSQDQNLILLDGVPVFSPFHLGGLFSVFNADMIERVELTSGGFGAEHGGRVSSVLRVESDVGAGETSVNGGVSLLSARAAVGGRVPEEVAEALGQTSLRYRLSARRSYFDLLFRPFFDFPYHLRDLQGLVEGWSSSGDRVTLTAYSGRDVLDLTRLDSRDFPLRIDWDWGNDLVGVRWTGPRRGGGSAEVAANVSRFSTGLSFPDFDDTEFSSRITQGQIRADLRARPTPAWRVDSGGEVSFSSYDNLLASGGTRFAGSSGSGTLVAGYLRAGWTRPASWAFEAGVRADGWLPDPGESVLEISPRLSVKRFFRSGNLALKAAVGRYTQFLHSLRDEDIPVGLDLWILSGERAPHLVSDQVQAGVEGYVGSEWFWSAEGYVRSFDGVVAVNPAENPNDPLDDVLSGRGRSVGVDLLLRRETGSVTGWVSLSLLDADRTFPDPFAGFVEQPEVDYPPIFDRRFEADVVLRYPVAGGWEGGLRWNFGTGIPFTRPEGAFASYSPRLIDNGGRLRWTEAGEDDPGDGLAIDLGDRNAARLPAYHRLDLSFRKTVVRSWGTLQPYLNLVNLYNRRNVLFYFFEFDDQPPVRSGISMFPLFPTFGVEVRF